MGNMYKETVARRRVPVLFFYAYFISRNFIFSGIFKKY